MIIVDDVRAVVEQIQKISDPVARQQAASWGTTTAIAATVYYIMLGIVVIVLGRRIINATQKAWKESRRQPG